MLDKRDWYAAGLEHVWLPYAQMKTARPPLVCVLPQGAASIFCTRSGVV